jgi:hypothetical protein
MTSHSRLSVNFPRVAAVAAAALVAMSLGLVADHRAEASGDALPLGDADLAETRTSQILAAGVTLTRMGRTRRHPTRSTRPGRRGGGPRPAWLRRAVVDQPRHGAGDGRDVAAGDWARHACPARRRGPGVYQQEAHPDQRER